ncbi:hypothetical protein ARMSODRAFT_978618 [Armillaria solidipes]|uniref:F-box domain-containing protein n=1 Tax=Armillaria solidipes TaxID=1076256 RepID=A0A2H3B5E9_9AGAR|nr:hypothetical protein ARMSODRAFT_978618 [Armillaria solidipes]
MPLDITLYSRRTVPSIDHIAILLRPHSSRWRSLVADCGGFIPNNLPALEKLDLRIPSKLLDSLQAPRLHTLTLGGIYGIPFSRFPSLCHLECAMHESAQLITLLEGARQLTSLQIYCMESFVPEKFPGSGITSNLLKLHLTTKVPEILSCISFPVLHTLILGVPVALSLHLRYTTRDVDNLNCIHCPRLRTLIFNKPVNIPSFERLLSYPIARLDLVVTTPSAYYALNSMPLPHLEDLRITFKSLSGSREMLRMVKAKKGLRNLEIKSESSLERIRDLFRRESFPEELTISFISSILCFLFNDGVCEEDYREMGKQGGVDCSFYIRVFKGRTWSTDQSCSIQPGGVSSAFISWTPCLGAGHVPAGNTPTHMRSETMELYTWNQGLRRRLKTISYGALQRKGVVFTGTLRIRIHAATLREDRKYGISYSEFSFLCKDKTTPVYGSAYHPIQSVIARLISKSDNHETMWPQPEKVPLGVNQTELTSIYLSLLGRMKLGIQRERPGTIYFPGGARRCHNECFPNINGINSESESPSLAAYAWNLISTLFEIFSYGVSNPVWILVTKTPPKAYACQYFSRHMALNVLKFTVLLQLSGTPKEEKSHEEPGTVGIFNIKPCPWIDVWMRKDWYRHRYRLTTWVFDVEG